MNLMPFDELNTFRQMVTEYKTEPLTQSEKEQLRDDIEDYIEFLLIEAYTYGNVQAMYDLGLMDEDPETLIKADEMYAEINKEIAGKTFRQRIDERFGDDSSTVEDFQRIAETDVTRVYNAGVVDGGKASGVPGVRKQWVTAGDERVRDPHQWLDGVIVPLDEKFYVDGDSAMAPGGFSLPELNVNCRCELRLIYE